MGTDKLKDNWHIGCIILFVLLAVSFIVCSIPKFKQKEVENTYKPTKDELERAMYIADSIHLLELMDDPFYIEVFEENEELKEKMKRIKEYTEDLEGGLMYFERKGFDVSELQDAIDNINSECE